MENAGIGNTFAIALPLRTMSALAHQRVLPQLVPSREARVYICCEHCGCVMDTESDFAETDPHILTFDIPDDVLERAAGAELALTLVHCTNPLVWECPAMGEVRRLLKGSAVWGV